VLSAGIVTNYIVTAKENRLCKKFTNQAYQSCQSIISIDSDVKGPGLNQTIDRKPD
jgi:hypothetical protein